MSSNPALIVVIDANPARAQKLKELIEFMDAPQVQIASPDDWRKRLRKRRLAAVFLDAGMEKSQQERLIQNIGEFDRNVPIVRINGERSDV